jgi:hypothetical protein
MNIIKLMPLTPIFSKILSQGDTIIEYKFQANFFAIQTPEMENRLY